MIKYKEIIISNNNHNIFSYDYSYNEEENLKVIKYNTLDSSVKDIFYFQKYGNYNYELHRRDGAAIENYINNVLVNRSFFVCNIKRNILDFFSTLTSYNQNMTVNLSFNNKSYYFYYEEFIERKEFINKVNVMFDYLYEINAVSIDQSHLNCLDFEWEVNKKGKYSL